MGCNKRILGVSHKQRSCVQQTGPWIRAAGVWGVKAGSGDLQRWVVVVWSHFINTITVYSDCVCNSFVLSSIGSIDLFYSDVLYSDLRKGLEGLVLQSHLHLLYLVTPYDMVTHCSPDWMIYFRQVKWLILRNGGIRSHPNQTHWRHPPFIYGTSLAGIIHRTTQVFPHFTEVISWLNLQLGFKKIN